MQYLPSHISWDWGKSLCFKDQIKSDRSGRSGKSLLTATSPQLKKEGGMILVSPGMKTNDESKLYIRETSPPRKIKKQILKSLLLHFSVHTLLAVSTLFHNTDVIHSALTTFRDPSLPEERVEMSLYWLCKPFSS